MGMNKEIVEIYSDASNIAVMRHPGRACPGILIQGDSLFSLVQLIKEAQGEIENGRSESAAEALEELSELLEGRLKHYEGVLEVHGMELPYVRHTQQGGQFHSGPSGLRGTPRFASRPLPVAL